ncbi:MAG TPA: uroporphyrinogen-III synthase [Candidatus Limnocylindria bacterium]|nr:uroporphyrinogen-III synthase [Candidatus Limnocylindria bacterium]
MRSRAIVLTRDAGTSAPLAGRLAARGWDVVVLPCVRTERAAPPELGPLGPDDVVVVTSAAGADAVLDVLPPGVPVAAVGAATARRLREGGVRPRFVPASATGAALGAGLPLPRGTVVLARSDRAGADLPAALRERGARVREVVAYRTVAAARGDAAAARAALLAGGTLVVASPSAVEASLASLGADALARSRVVACGPTTARAVREMTGLTAEEHRWDALEDMLA